jgi:hypothetical protein
VSASVSRSSNSRNSRSRRLMIFEDIKNYSMQKTQMFAKKHPDFLGVHCGECIFSRRQQRVAK